MPCGGIYPVRGSWVEQLPNPPGKVDIRCWQCGKSTPVPTHFCDEWDTFLHAECIDAFLNSEEGRVVMEHGHEVIR